MIGINEQELILDFLSKTISEDEFLKRYPVDIKSNPLYVMRELEEAFKTKNADQVEFALLIAFSFGNQERSAELLCQLLLEDWHFQHENIASMLQRLRDPRSIECLYQTALMHFTYLDYDEAYALAVKCIWALGDINTVESKHKLFLLSFSDNDIIKENALCQLHLHE